MKHAKIKYWKVTAELNWDASNVQSVTIKANTQRKAYEEGKVYFQKNGACNVIIITVKEIDEATELRA